MDKIKRIIYNIIIPIVLFLIPLRHVNQGIDISDTGYTLANFKWFGIIDYPWHYSIVGANVIGKALMKLPFGSSWMGINLYCSLIISIMSVIIYFFLKKRLNGTVAALGIYLAQMMCWCPQVILYNYLTYIFLNIGAMLIVLALEYGNAGMKKKEVIIYFLTGILLGLEVCVRLANLDHMALVTLIWYSGFVYKEKIKDIIFKTVVCVVGYVVGLVCAVGVVVSTTISGIPGYLAMVKWVGNVSSTSEGYSAVYMLTSPFLDYIDSLKWFVPFLIIAGSFFFVEKKVVEKATNKLSGKEFVEKTSWLPIVYRIVYVLLLLLVLRVLYGRGMFGLDYNEYFSIIRPICIFIPIGIVVLVWAVIFGKERFDNQEKLLFLAALVIIFVLPLGSNNRSYPVLNNLFLVAPVVLWIMYKWMPKNFEIRALATVMGIFLLVQATGFGYTFVFRDSSAFEKRNTKIENSAILDQMKTTASKAKMLMELSQLVQDRELVERTGIFYGDIAGLSFALDIKSALPGIWVSLESYSWKQWNDDMGLLCYEATKGNHPVVFVSKEYDVFPDDDKKRESLDEYMGENDYVMIYDSDLLSVYDVR